MWVNPTLIFAHTNTDPIATKILTKLTLKLKNMGYACFLDEVNKDATLLDQLAQIENNLQIYNQLESQFKAQGLDILNPDHLEKFVLMTIMNMGISLARYSAQDFLIKIAELIHNHPAVLASKTFLETLAKNQIDYQGVNPRQLDKFTSLSFIYAMDRFRDETLADTYINADTPIFGRIDLAHIATMQRDILKKISLREASARFCFLNIYANPQSEIGMLPIPMLNINASDKTEDEIVSIIVKNIIERFVLLKEFSNHATLIKDASEIDFETFKEAYFKKYADTFFLFKNPFSKMKRSLENNEIKSMEDVLKYAELYPNTRTGDVIRSIKKP